MNKINKIIKTPIHGMRIQVIHNIKMKGYANKCWGTAAIANGFHIKSSHHPLTILISSKKKDEIRNKK